MPSTVNAIALVNLSTPINSSPPTNASNGLTLLLGTSTVNTSNGAPSAVSSRQATNTIATGWNRPTQSAQPGVVSQSCSNLKSFMIVPCQILVGIAGLFAAYLALSLAMWTAMKDYRDDCRSQNVRFV
jgi:hypothetical protein